MKIYLNHSTTDRSTSATDAMSWHRAGDAVQVLTFDNNGKELADVMIQGAAQEKKGRLGENEAHCKRIAEKIEEYVSGNVRRCPDCGAEITRDWGDVGDAFKCSECGAVGDVDWWDVLSVWDYLSDVYNVEFRVNGKSVDDLRSVQIMVACGGPNIYLDTETKSVELYWWGDRASYPISYSVADALDEWAAEYWGGL